MRHPRYVKTAAAVGGLVTAGFLVGRLAEPLSFGGQKADIGPATGTVLRVDTITRIARARSSAVVFLHTTNRSSIATGPLSEDGVLLPRQLPEPVREALGSGIVIDDQGFILTNAHLVDGMRTVHVRTPDNDDRDATIVSADPVTDLALLRVKDKAGLQRAPFGDSDAINVGDWVIAVGSPFGLHHTLTAGIVSAKGRVLGEAGVELFQTDAAINPGSSGGPIFDLSGAVVGISTALVSGAGENVGLNFAVPINVAREILPQLRSGEVVHGWIGVRTMELTRSGASLLGLDSPGGLAVMEVVSAGPAARAGLKIGDVILGTTDEPRRPTRDLLARVRRSKPGTVIPLRVWRRNETRDVDLTVGRWTADR